MRVFSVPDIKKFISDFQTRLCLEIAFRREAASHHVVLVPMFPLLIFVCVCECVCAYARVIKMYISEQSSDLKVLTDINKLSNTFKQFLTDMAIRG